MALFGAIAFLTYLPCIFKEHNLSERNSDGHSPDTKSIQMGTGKSLYFIDIREKYIMVLHHIDKSDYFHIS